MIRRTGLVFFLALQAFPLWGALSRDKNVFLLPLECSELIPDSSPYLQFFEAVGRGCLRSDKAFATRIFKIIALRDKLQASAQQSRDQNPIDILIRRTLCFYREKNEPLKMVSFEDSAFLEFLRGSLGDLEAKVDEAILKRETDKQQLKEYERILSKNRDIEESVRSKAELEADRRFEKLSSAARRKIKAP